MVSEQEHPQLPSPMGVRVFEDDLQGRFLAVHVAKRFKISRHFSYLRLPSSLTVTLTLPLFKHYSNVFVSRSMDIGAICLDNAGRCRALVTAGTLVLVCLGLYGVTGVVCH